MTENHENKLSLINDILNDFLSFDGNIEYKVVLEPFDEVITHFSVEATIDSAMYHMVSPDYNPNYDKFINHLDDKIYKLVDRYFGDEIQFEVVVFFHKNVDKVISVAKPMLDKAMKVYSQQNHKPVLKYKFLSTQRRPELVLHGLFDDFYITGILGYTEKDRYLNKVYESVENNKVTCDECGWSWDLSDGGNDPYTCHKCGHENKNPHD